MLHLLLFVLFPLASEALIRQNQLFGDNMVLESREAYDIRPFVSGFGTVVGEPVSVSFNGKTYNTTVGDDFTWDVQMDCCDRETGKTLVVTGRDNTLTYIDVACGQVFICSGQSNMELPLSYVFNGTQEIAAATRPNWRLFTVPHTTASTPQTDFTGGNNTRWKPCSPQTVPNFSAVCYLTAQQIARMYWGNDAPIGLIQSTWGGTRVEAWTPDTQQIQAACSSAAGPAPAPLPGPQAAGALYNGMIAPLTRYSIRAAFWFQGEHNVVTHSSRQRYGCEFGAMVNAWRDAFTGIGDFPFLAVQLAPYTGYAPFAGHGDTSVVRLAQADALPHIGLDTTGMAVTIDLGDPSAPAGDVHSRHKEEVSRRLALQALHVAYAFQEGEPIVNEDHPEETPEPYVALHFSGPVLRSAVHDSTITTTILTFAFAGDVHTSPPSMLYLKDTLGCNATGSQECCAARNTFELCTGSAAVNANTTELQCANATAVKLEAGGIVTLTGAAPGGATPTVVRHAYSNFPMCALYNTHGLPASPFVAAIESKHVVLALDPESSADPPAKTPPMGLNSWNAFHCNVDERKMRAMADALVSTGLAKAGYNFVNIDDCWQVQRSPNGTINADPARFPGGMKALADYVHSLGLKFGVYSAQHEFTCQRRPGSYLHEAIDVQSYCDWGVDYVKLDGCRGGSYPNLNTSWIKFRAAIDACVAKRGSPMVLSVESCDDPSPSGCSTWVGGLANLWRTCGDIQMTFSSVMNNVAQNTKMAAFAGPTGGPGGGGHWNDADMLQVGNIGMSLDEQSSHFSLWSIMASPLLIGSDVSMLSNESLAILGNTEVTAINQDALGVQGVPVGHGADDARTAPCWAKPLSNNDLAVLLLNTNSSATTVTCSLAELGVPGARAAKVRDLLKHADVPPPETGGALSVQLRAHAHAFFRVTPLH